MKLKYINQDYYIKKLIFDEFHTTEFQLTIFIKAYSIEFVKKFRTTSYVIPTTHSQQCKIFGVIICKLVLRYSYTMNYMEHVFLVL